MALITVINSHFIDTLKIGLHSNICLVLKLVSIALYFANIVSQSFAKTVRC